MLKPSIHTLPRLEPTHPSSYTARMAHLHDSGYKYLFSHAELVQELLETFAQPGVSELLDYTTLRLESGNYVTPAMKPRADDLVWSVELQGRRINHRFQSVSAGSVSRNGFANRAGCDSPVSISSTESEVSARNTVSAIIPVKAISAGASTVSFGAALPKSKDAETAMNRNHGRIICPLNTTTRKKCHRKIQKDMDSRPDLSMGKKSSSLDGDAIHDHVVDVKI